MRPIIPIAFCVGLALAAPAVAQEHDRHLSCGPAEEGLSYLKKHYDEGVKWRGQDAAGREFVLTTSDKGTWTLLVVTMDQDKPIACIAASDGGSPHEEENP